jgi:signal transduction histidine kinase
MLVAAPQAARAGVRLINRTDATTELEVQGDALLLREALMNLINNAIDATRPGGCVEIAYGMRHTRVYIAVADNGVGVSPENRQRLFEPHFTTKQSGSGMGLFTSFGIIREHRGRLLFDSRNPGSVFTIMLPIA